MTNEATLIGFRLLFDEDGSLMSETTETPMKAFEELPYEDRLVISAAVSGAKRAINEALRYIDQEVNAIK